MNRTFSIAGIMGRVILALLLPLGGAFGTNKVDEVLKTAGVQTIYQAVSDETFVRRSYLNVVGRIPTFEEYTSFMGSRALNKRTVLVSQLVKTEGYVSHWSNFWMDLLRGKARLNETNYFSGEPYMEYVSASIRKNEPYDKMTNALLTAQGHYYDSPAIGYFYRDVGMPLDNFVGTMKVFLGLDISCAQCHDDPFQSWTRREFYEGAAFFTQIKMRDENKAVREKIKEVLAEVRLQKPGLDTQILQFLKASNTSLEIEPSKTLRLPSDYKPDDAKPNDLVSARPFFGESPTPSTDKRTEFIAWMYNTDEYAQNIANRMWGYVFGEPIVPTHNLRADTTPMKRSVLVSMGKLMKAMKYDTRAFALMLYSSDFFQRSPYYGDVHQYALQAPTYHRLSAEQIWDSVITLHVGSPDYFASNFVAEYQNIVKINFETLTAVEAISKQEAYREAKKNQYEKAKKFGPYQLIRASAITDFNSADAQLLKKFGRSDRELINAGSREGSGTQVMAFMNGAFADIVLSPKSKFSQEQAARKDKRDATNYAFISILGRHPNLSERDFFANYSTDDLNWALLNSIEFKFN